MKSLKLNLWLIGATLVASMAWGQFPYGASDTTYGLRSRIAENPSFTYTPSPADWRDINIYQLFTDRFADGDSANNTTSAAGIDRSGWSESGKSFPWNRNYHHGGDWKGLKDNLDYLDNMGVKAIWISGVQMNNQGKDTRYTPYHQYHPTDFYRAEPTSGTFLELKDLIDECHARGIYVILDVVINHMADLNGLWGNSQEDDKQYWASGNGTHGWWDSRRHAAPFTDLSYFHNNGTINCWDCSPENLLGQFKGTDDLKTEDGTVQGWLDDAFKNLIDATDCDGFRVDAIKHVEYNWCKSWADSMRQHAATRGKSDFILFGELFSYDNGALASYCQDSGYSFNSALFFPMSQNIKNVFVDNNNPNQLTQQLNNRGTYGEGANRLVTFIDNHDVNRIALLNGGDTGDDVWKLRPALSFLYLGTPVPCLFYGTEHVFDQGGHYNGSDRSTENPDDGDWQRETMFNRGFQPGPAAGDKLAATSAPLYQHIAALNAAREAHKSLTRGSFTERWADSAYAFSRVYDVEESLVAINIGDGSKSMNPEVGKPDGTVFVNAFDSGDTVTVSGGRIDINLSGKETKIYVAGIAEPEMWVRGTHNSPADGDATAVTPIFVNTEAGPTGVVASAKVGYSADGGTTWEVLLMSETNWASSEGTWFFRRLGSFPADTVIEYYIEIADGDDNKIWDNNSGANYTLTVQPAAGIWVRNSKNYPVDGDATDLTDLYLNAEAGPSGEVTSVTASFTIDDGATWVQTNMALNASWGSDGGNWYEVNLGQFPADTQVMYYIEATDGATTFKDDNGGVNFQVTIRSGVVDTLWMGVTAQIPENGSITAASNIVIQAESWPIDAATNVMLAYTSNGGADWLAAGFTHTGTNGNNDTWSVDLGTFADGTIVQYAAVAESATRTNWDNNGGADYQAIVGDVGGLRMVEHTPLITTAGAPDNAGDDFDFDTSGGAATTGGTAGFGSFGSIYVNYDDSNLYIGGTDVALPDDSMNNAYMVFLGGGTNTGLPNFWAPSGNPQGLDNTHNAAFQPNINVAILLGDVWGDGNFPSFEMYTGGGFDFGQGVFALTDGAADFAPIAGTQLSQFGGYGMDSRLAANWECAIPLSIFGVTNAAQLTNLYLSGLMVTGDNDPSNSVNRFISGRYLGDSATLGNGEEADEWGNFAFSFVNLGGTKVAPPSAFADLGIPESWVTENLGAGYDLTESSNNDGDPRPDRYEYFAGLNPASNDFLYIQSMGGGQLGMHKHGGQSCAYVIDIADKVENGGWNWTPHSTVSSLDGMIAMPDLGLSNLIMRVRVNVPPVNQPVDSVNVSAAPAGGSFSTDGLNVTLHVSGVNVNSSTYSLGFSPLDYTNGQIIAIGTGFTNNQVAQLTLAGSTVNGITDQEIYTFTKTDAALQVSWTGSVATDPAAGAWDAGEGLTISFETTPIGAAVAANLVYNDGSGWVNTPMTQGAANASNDTWSISLGSYAAGTTVQFALEAKDGEDNSTWNNNDNNDYFMTVNGGGGPGGDEPYSTNPTKGQYRAAGITIDGANTGGEWTTSMLIALDMANDDPRSLGDNWTMHEAPIDFTHLWACWDDDNLYLAFQFVDITDVIDGANAGGAASGKISNNQGHLISISLNTQTGGSTTDMWDKSNSWDGPDTPDFQMYMRGDLWDGALYMSTALAGNTWAGDPELGTTYNTFAGWGISVANGNVYAGGSELWGVGDADNRLDVDAPNRNFLAEGHDTSRDSFYEISIPMSAIGISKAQLESSGIAVFLTGGSESALDTIPNSAATSDTPGVEVYNSSFEWSDADSYTEGFARIGN